MLLDGQPRVNEPGQGVEQQVVGAGWRGIVYPSGITAHRTVGACLQEAHARDLLQALGSHHFYSQDRWGNRGGQGLFQCLEQPGCVLCIVVGAAGHPGDAL